MRVLIGTTKMPFVQGGAESHALNLAAAIRAAGHEADTVEIPFFWSPPERILDHALACRLLSLIEIAGTRIDLFIGMKFPAYCIPHPNKVIWLLHQHRSAYELWDHPEAGDMLHFPFAHEVRHAIHKMDRLVMAEAKTIFANSRTVAERLRKYLGVESTPLYHPPPSSDALYCAAAEDYLFYPGLLNRMKRQELILEALSRTRRSVVVRFAGSPEQPEFAEYLRVRARELGIRKRAIWLGRISSEELIEQYARCRGVVYPPLDEDYGYVTLEAMLASKPVITCTDSAGPTEFVIGGETGLVVEPEARELAAAMDRIWSDPATAEQMGRSGRLHYESLDISWRSVVERLISD